MRRLMVEIAFALLFVAALLAAAVMSAPHWFQLGGDRMFLGLP